MLSGINAPAIKAFKYLHLMKGISKMKAHNCAIGIVALLMLGVGSMANANVSGKTGTLTLYGAKGESDTNKCQVPMNNGRVVMGKGHGCKNDDYHYFKISLGQPGTIVSFHDSPNCTVSQPTYRYLITGGYDDDVNMTAIQALAHDGSTHKVIQSHLETFGSPRKGRLHGKLSCVVFSQY